MQEIYVKNSKDALGSPPDRGISPDAQSPDAHIRSRRGTKVGALIALAAVCVTMVACGGKEGGKVQAINGVPFVNNKLVTLPEPIFLSEGDELCGYKIEGIDGDRVYYVDGSGTLNNFGLGSFDCDEDGRPDGSIKEIVERWGNRSARVGIYSYEY